MISDQDAELDELLLATARGDRAAFERLYIRTSPQLFGVILRILGHRDSSADVLQEVFLRIWTKASTYQPGLGSPMGWLATIARRRALDWRRNTLPDANAVSLEVLDGAEAVRPGQLVRNLPDPDSEQLKQCLEELPPRQRTCVVLAYVAGYTHEELAVGLNRPVGTVKSWIRRGLARLKACLGS